MFYDIIYVMVLWGKHRVESGIWEAEVDMMSQYPHLFAPILA